MPDGSQICQQVIYSGRVQGVGFRYTTSRISKKYDVTGFVKNLSDGTVELVACGTPEEVNRFLESIATHFYQHIEDMVARDIDDPGEYNRFKIQR